jgi:hypothetical protein
VVRGVSVTGVHKISPHLLGFSRKKFVLAAAIGLLLAGCGQYVGIGSNPTPTPSQVEVTDQDHAATLHVGQRLEVILHSPNGMNSWTHPKSSDESVLTPVVDTRATAPIGVTLAAFQAVKAGDAEVTATASPKCPPGSACPMYVAFYSLKVTVTP